MINFFKRSLKRGFTNKQKYDILSITSGAAIGMLLSRRSAWGSRNNGGSTIKNVVPFYSIIMEKDPNDWEEWQIEKVLKEGEKDTVDKLKEFLNK